MSAGLLGYVWQGLVATLQLTVLGALLGGAFAFAAGIGRVSRSRVVRAVAFTYTEVFRGFSSLVLLFMMIFVLPQLLGYQLNTMLAAVLSLALYIGSYAAEVVRGALQSVPAEQLEAAVALNFTPLQRLRKVVLPQAVVAMIPPLSNNLIELLKTSSLVSLVYIHDLAFAGKLINASTGDSTLVYLGLLVGYGFIALALTVIMRVLERMAARRLGREPRPLLRRGRAAA